MGLARAGVPSGRTLGVWMACSLVAVGASIRFGFRDERQGLRVALERGIGALFFGVALGAVVVGIVAAWLPNNIDEPRALAVFLVTGPLLVALARWSLPRVLPFEDIPGGPGGLLPASAPAEAGAAYALAPTQPALSAAETERDAPAVEIRVLWGGDLLAVRHLAPPRPFHVGDAACDFALDGEPLGTPRFPLVTVERGAVSVVAPRGAAGRIHAGDRLLAETLERAVAEGLAAPSPGLPGATKIPLAAGARVTLSLPSGAAATAYRAAPAAEDATHARLVLEVALVRAGRVVGRGIAWRAQGRILASTALAAAVIGGGLAALDATVPVPDPDDDGISSDDQYLIAQGLAKIEEGVHPEMEEEPAPPPVESTRTGGPWWEPRRERSRWSPEIDAEPLPFRSLPEAEMFGPRTFCWSLGWDEGFADRARDFGTVMDAYCRFAPVTPFGLRLLGEQVERDLFGRDPGDLWRTQLEDARRGLRAAPTSPAPRSAIAVEPRGQVPDFMLATVRRHARDLAACHALGLAENDLLTGAVDLELTVGADAVARGRVASTTTLTDERVARCMAGALAGPWRIDGPARVWHGLVRVRARPDPAPQQPVRGRGAWVIPGP
jgi:hypothetical protein